MDDAIAQMRSACRPEVVCCCRGCVKWLCGMSENLESDVVIIGAGPVGLFAVFSLGLLDMRATVVDILDKPGGQCAELYPDKPIYDIPALPEVSGAELTERLLLQVKPFSPRFCLGERVERLHTDKTNGRWRLTTDANREILAKVVVVAAGGGSFTPKRLPVKNAESYEGRSLFYAVRDWKAMQDKRVVIAGGGDSALDWTRTLAHKAARVTLLHRRRDFRGVPSSVRAVHSLADSGDIDFLVGQIVALEGVDGWLRGIHVRKEGGEVTFLDCERLLLFFGLTMRTGPLASFGLEMEGKRVRVSNATFESSRRGIFAVGDVNCYPGKQKLILSGFHEAALMSHAAFPYVYPSRRLRFQYTTTSKELHRRLGVDDGERKA